MMHQHSPVPVYILMGTCGSGKTSVALELQSVLGCEFIEGDKFHPPANVNKMSNGIPLTDDDRWDWLKMIKNKYVEQSTELFEQSINKSRVILVTCSALKRVYRDILNDVPLDRCSITYVYLKASFELISNRMKMRKDHFMSVNMLISQMEILEEPDPNEESVIIQSIEPDVKDICENLAKIIEMRLY